MLFSTKVLQVQSRLQSSRCGYTVRMKFYDTCCNTYKQKHMKKLQESTWLDEYAL